MSIRHMALVWDDPYFTNADKSTLLVALALADNARQEDGRAWPSVDSIARRARTSIRGAQESCRKLEKDGKIKVEPGKGPHGTNVYLLCWTPQRLHPATVAPCNGAPVKAPVKPPLRCTQTIRNGQEPHESPPPIPASASLSLEEKAEQQRQKRLPTKEPAIRIANMFRRKLTTEWSDAEIKSYRKIGTIDLEELALVERYYKESGCEYLRRDLGTFLNHFRGEVDRARQWAAPKNGKPSKMFLTE